MHSTVSKVCVGNSMLECAEKKEEMKKKTGLSKW